MEFVIFVEPI